MFKVIKLFTDLQDENHRYEVGDEFPREGLEVSLARLKELSSKNNKQGTPLIEEVREELKEEVKKPKKKTSKKK